MGVLDTVLQGISTVSIIGHVRPDGDCIGSSLAIYNYLSEQYPALQTDIYLEPPSEKFSYLKNFDQICSDSRLNKEYDLCICVDCSDKTRFGEFTKYLEHAKNSLCVDHHITNSLFARENVVEPHASSTCEVLFGLLEEEKISKDVAECLYTGIIHDTGVFKHDCTSSKTMIIAGKLMEKGISFGKIIDDSFYTKSYIQNQILGRALLESISILGGKCIFSVIRKKDMDFYGVDSGDLDGIVDQLRVTQGVQCAVFLYETGVHEYKVSLRSNTEMDVSKIAVYFGGGGHIKAAGCTMSGSIHDVVNNLSVHIEKQLI